MSSPLSVSLSRPRKYPNAATRALTHAQYRRVLHKQSQKGFPLSLLRFARHFFFSFLFFFLLCFSNLHHALFHTPWSMIRKQFRQSLNPHRILRLCIYKNEKYYKIKSNNISNINLSQIHNNNNYYYSSLNLTAMSSRVLKNFVLGTLISVATGQS